MCTEEMSFCFAHDVDMLTEENLFIGRNAIALDCVMLRWHRTILKIINEPAKQHA